MRVEIISRIELFKRLFFRFEEIRLRHETFSGNMSDEIVRLNMDRGDGVAVVLHDRTHDTVIMVEQFRASTYDAGVGWLMEIPAGILKPGEDPAEAVKREILEETGYQVVQVTPISTFFLSPGGTSERIFLYYAAIREDERLHAGGGLIEEHEDLRVSAIPITEAFAKVARGEIVDAKTIIGLQWLQLQLLKREE